MLQSAGCDTQDILTRGIRPCAGTDRTACKRNSGRRQTVQNGGNVVMSCIRNHKGGLSETDGKLAGPVQAPRVGEIVVHALPVMDQRVALLQEPGDPALPGSTAHQRMVAPLTLEKQHA